MYGFINDYSVIAHPNIMKRMSEINLDNTLAKEFAIFKRFCCFIKSLDFDSRAVSVDDSFWIHEDGNHVVSFDVGELWHQP